MSLMWAWGRGLGAQEEMGVRLRSGPFRGKSVPGCYQVRTAFKATLRRLSPAAPFDCVGFLCRSFQLLRLAEQQMNVALETSGQAVPAPFTRPPLRRNNVATLFF